jgi:hypothetical protein
VCLCEKSFLSKHHQEEEEEELPLFCMFVTLKTKVTHERCHGNEADIFGMDGGTTTMREIPKRRNDKTFYVILIDFLFIMF